MKNTMKKIAAALMVLLMMAQIIPAMADQYSSSPIAGGSRGFRDDLELIAPKGTYVLVGQTLELSATEGYTLTWSSANEEVAIVDDAGVVTAVAAGEVVITAQEGKSGQYKASITVTVINPQADEQTAQTPDQPEQTSVQKQYMIIVINGESVRYVYDGQPHTLDTFVATSNDAGFSADKVKVNGTIGVSATNCGTYQFVLEESNFSYDDPNVIASFMVNNGWMKITPAQATVAANSVEKQAGDADPELTATVTGTFGDDTLEYSFERYPGEEAGDYIIDVIGEQKQGNYKVQFVPGVMTINKVLPEWPLYNIIKIGDTYYRLAKTKIWTEKDPNKDKNGVINANDYTVEKYDFTNLEIEYKDKKYVYNCKENSEAIILGANYYEVDEGTVSIVKNKIGAINKSTNQPNWMVPEEDRYPDKNETNSIHRDFKVTLHDGRKTAVEQTAYNFLSVDGSKNYYKLRTTTVTAQPLDTLPKGKIADGEYILEAYDFTNVTVTIDGVEYKYNNGSLDEYENYFTVTFENLEKNDKFNRDDNWFKNTESWLDGAYEEYGTLKNSTTVFHANYIATTHKAEARKRTVTISSDWPAGKVAYPGAEITLTATLDGFSENVTLQWQHSTNPDNEESWTDGPGANAITYTYTLDDTTAYYYWRVVADDEN